jgi:predicted amidophosphoribosyltransferase
VGSALLDAELAEDDATCAKCGRSLDLDEQDRGASFCATCAALLDEEMETPPNSTSGVDGLPRPPPPRPDYAAEDHAWAMNHPYWGLNPRDRDS